MGKTDENAGFRELVKGLQTVLAKATKQLSKPAKKKKKAPKKQQVVLDPTDKLIQDTEKECAKLAGRKAWFINGQNDHNLNAAEVLSMKWASTFYIRLKTDYENNESNSDIASFRISYLPGCGAVFVSHDMWIVPEYRNKGLNNVLNAFKIELAKLCGYSVLICTDRVDNEPEKKTLAKNGWKDVHRFTNRTNGAAIDITVKDIPL